MRILRRFFPFFIIILCILCTCKKDEAVPVAENGTIDLSQWDFATDGQLRLTGEWHFYWKKLLNPEDFKAFKKYIKPVNLQVPSDWKKVKNLDKIKQFGYATYRLKIINYIPNQRLAVKMPMTFTAYKLWVNNKLLIQNGKVGITRLSYKPEDVPKMASFTLNSTINYITVQVANFDDISSGICYAPIIGTERQLLKRQNLKESVEIFLFGAILIFSLYHFGLFLQRKNDRSTLYFGLFCLIIAIRGIVMGERFIMSIIPIDFELSRKIEHLTMYLSLPTFSLFIYSIFSEEISEKYINIILLLGNFFSLLVIFTPFRFFVNFLYFYDSLIIISAIYFIISIFFAMSRKKDEAIIFLIGLFIISVAIILEILYINNKIEVGLYAPFGFFLFLLAQSFILSKKFANIFIKAEKLSQELLSYSYELEKKVKLRTKQLEEVNQQKTIFFINIAHEIKTPLTLISSYLEEYIKRTGYNKEIKIIKKNVEKLKNDMTNFLDTEKLTTGKLIYDHNQIFNLSSLLHEKVILFEKNAMQKGISLAHRIEEDLYIKADPFAIDRIFNNLIENAIKYTLEGGQISVYMEQANEKIIFKVQDNGIGIPEEQIKHIFSEYYQITRKKSNIQGIGMGLNIVKKVLESINAEIKVASIPKIGSTFTVLFNNYTPQKDDLVISDIVISKPTDSLSVFKKAAEQNIEKGKHNILIVEDNIDLLINIQQNMKDKYNVYVAANGKEALEKLNDINEIELIVSDIMMDVMDGYEFYEIISKTDRFKETPFIFLTAKTSLNDKIKGLARGAIDYIYKPFSMDELRLKIDSIIKNQDLRKTLYEKDKYASLGMLFGGISHEILNPLGAIHAPLENLENYLDKVGHAEDTKTKQYIDRMYSNLNRIENIIKTMRLLYYSSNLNKSDIMENDIETIITSLIQQNEKNIKNHVNITYTIEKNVSIFGNKNALHYILQNLLSNSLDAVNTDGKIAIFVEKKQDDTVIRFKDNGIGILEEESKKIFNAFYTKKEVGKGTGLGLYIVKDLIMKLEWDIKVISEPGKGTEFIIKT